MFLIYYDCVTLPCSTCYYNIITFPLQFHILMSSHLSYLNQSPRAEDTGMWRDIILTCHLLIFSSSPTIPSFHLPCSIIMIVCYSQVLPKPGFVHYFYIFIYTTLHLCSKFLVSPFQFRLWNRLWNSLNLIQGCTMSTDKAIARMQTVKMARSSHWSHYNGTAPLQRYGSKNCQSWVLWPQPWGQRWYYDGR